jgi:parallel beta-helix repeat protein
LEFAYSPGSAIRFGGTTSGITIELCNIHHNVRLDANGAGIEVGGSASNYLILNNDIHRQSINQPSGTGGDGLGFYGVQQSGNIIRGNRIWRNHDDGVDLWDSANILLENNWSWENGYNDNLSATSGNGVGYKLGGTGSGDGNHTLRNNLAWNNLTHGFDNNSADRPIFFFNNTGYKNVWNFVVASGSPNAAHQLKNNLSYLGNAASTTSLTIQTTNSWNTITPSAGTFVSLDFTANLGARKSDGSLPDSNFLKLNPSASSGNNAVDRGTNIGFSFDGSAPDLGAYEFTNSPASLAAPSNLLVQP